MILIVTRKDDLTADYLITHLIQDGTPYFRLNSDEASDLGCLFEAGPTAKRQLSLAGRDVNLNKTRSVWYRRSVYPSLSSGLPQQERAFVSGEVRHLLEGLIIDPTIRWVNPMVEVQMAERKVYQLRVASHLGFLLPETVVSNSPDVLREFAKRHKDEVICKPIYQGLHITESASHAVYTRSVCEADLGDDEELRACPTLLQRRVRRGSDIRVTVVGGKVFSAEIISPDNEMVDWRRPGTQVRYCPYELPNDMKDKCLQMLKTLGLVYGAFDFVRDPSGNLFFLEVNPTGEWVWIEHALDFPIGRALIELLLSAPSSTS